jgi:hypothetical protein
VGRGIGFADRPVVPALRCLDLGSPWAHWRPRRPCGPRPLDEVRKGPGIGHMPHIGPIWLAVRACATSPLEALRPLGSLGRLVGQDVPRASQAAEQPNARQRPWGGLGWLGWLVASQGRKARLGRCIVQLLALVDCPSSSRFHLLAKNQGGRLDRSCVVGGRGPTPNCHSRDRRAVSAVGAAPLTSPLRSTAVGVLSGSCGAPAPLSGPEGR